jgi:hypothetical protein
MVSTVVALKRGLLTHGVEQSGVLLYFPIEKRFELRDNSFE